MNSQPAQAAPYLLAARNAEDGAEDSPGPADRALPPLCGHQPPC